MRSLASIGLFVVITFFGKVAFADGVVFATRDDIRSFDRMLRESRARETLGERSQKKELETILPNEAKVQLDKMRINKASKIERASRRDEDHKRYRQVREELREDRKRRRNEDSENRRAGHK